MRMQLKCHVPSKEGNEGIKNGTFQKLIDYFQSEFKPEAMYFLAENGCRTAVIYLDIKDPSQIPVMAEPWFLAMNAKIDITPVMIPDDLAKADPGIEKVVRKFGDLHPK